MSKTSESKRSKASEVLWRKWTKDKVDLVHKKRPNTTSLSSDFPPPPASRELRHSVITEMCADFAPAAFEESGCAVCGRLTNNANLSPKDNLNVDWSLLASNRTTRKERLSAEDPIEELDGPILAAGCDMVCTECESKMLKHVTPQHSLANHLWVGELPWQLKDLTWAERMMIAKVRHNRCVVRVASGRGKLVANAIMFATPIRKVYDVLPISRDELSQVLAFVFIGSARPTEKEFVRTPMFDYECLEISQDNLDAIPEEGIPCGLDWKESTEGDSNLVAEAMSVDNAGEVDDGTADGPCSFAVAGLTGEQYALDDIRTLKMKALDHLKSGGKTLGIGQAEEPESTFANLQLYPQTFPWLFPYGHGGIGHPTHKRVISEEEHKRHLLMYHDKRFQLDMYFPMVAFNDAQIKSAKSGSHVMADRKKFASIAQRLASLEPEVLADLAARLEKGEHIKQKTPAEQVCFDLLDDLEH
ncbi:hypothetical protein DFH08DRAFT_721191, partial [Mycena albidolilacea]